MGCVHGVAKKGIQTLQNMINVVVIAEQQHAHTLKGGIDVRSVGNGLDSVSRVSRNAGSFGRIEVLQLGRETERIQRWITIEGRYIVGVRRQWKKLIFERFK